jgi:hypothetical protein
MTQKKTIEEILDKFFNKIVDDEETYEKCIKQAKSDISALVKEIIGEDYSNGRKDSQRQRAREQGFEI